MSQRRARALSFVACVLLACEDPASATIERDSTPPTKPAVQTDAASRHDAEPVDDAGLDAAGRALDAAATLPDAAADEDGAASDDASMLADGGASAPRERAMLVLPALWLPLDPQEDPFTDRPEASHCAPSGLMPELLAGESVFSVDTGACTYVTVRQPTQREIEPDEVVELRLWHFELSAPEPAEAHAAVVIEGLVVLDQRVPIPQPGGLISTELRVDRVIPAGTPVYFHLHNHGANSWSLVELSAGP